MANITKCFVEIFFIHDDFITFDFGNFAIVIGRNSENKIKEFHYYFKNDYVKKFMKRWAPKIGRVVDLVVINFEEFEKIEKTALKLTDEEGEANRKKLFYLLRSNFLKQMKLYGI